MEYRRTNSSQTPDINFSELCLLYQFSNTLLSTLRLNKLTHLILTALTSGNRPLFERAMLFLFNERAGALQGMLGVTNQQKNDLMLVGEDVLSPESRWDISDAVIARQLASDFCKKVRATRIDIDDNCKFINSAISNKRYYCTNEPHDCEQPVCKPISRLGVSVYAAIPLLSKDKLIGIVIVDNPISGKPITADDAVFLKLFAGQAGMAMGNSMLYNRVEEAHTSLRDTREHLIHAERMAVIGEMATNLVHELKNPLITIGGFAARLAKALPAHSKEHKYADTIEKETGHLEKMLTDILAFSRKPTTCYTRCDLAEIIRDGLESSLATMEDRGIAVNFTNLDGPWLVQGDFQQLRQVFLNLLLNAADAMPKGGVIEITAPNVSTEAKFATVCIADTGGGVPAEIQNLIFNPFFTTKPHGTGLGLSIIKRILQNHNGSISVANSEHGAVFCVTLPLS